MGRKLIYVLCTLTVLLATFVASTSAYASYPWLSYQPKMPKSLIKAD